jgi:Mannosyltransferase (PIG-V)
MAEEANPRTSPALREAARLWALTRGAVLLVAVFAALTAGPSTGGQPKENARVYDTPELTHPLGGFGDVVLSPLARWDAVWYLRIADSGYGEDDDARAAFFPLYPMLSRGIGQLGGGSEAAVLIASYLVALAAFLGALYLLYRLVSLELGTRLARPTLLLLAVFPASLFFGAPYSESLFLLACVGAFYAARTGHWALAGAWAAGAAATRSLGVLLLLPLAVLYFQQDRRLRPDVLWLALGPLGLAAYATYLGVAHGDALAFTHVQEAWYRDFAGPFGGIWEALVAAFDGARQLLSGSRETVYFEPAGGDPFRVAAMNLMLFGFLVFAFVALYGVLRRLPLAYGLWLVAALALPLSYPVDPQPLMSLPRFLAVLFPIFMWLALVCEERGWTDRVASASALGLGLFTTQFATWHWIA